MGLERHLKTFSKFLAVPLLSFFLSMCSVDYYSNEPKPTQKPNVSQGVNILSQETLNNIQSVTANSISFYNSTAQTNSLNPGFIILGSPNSVMPNGVLRTVTGTSLDKKTIFTNPASIENLADNFNVSFQSGQLSGSKYTSSLQEGISKTEGSRYGFNYNINTLIDLDGNSSTTYDQILITGSVSFDSSFYIDFNVRNFRMNELRFENKTIENLNLTASSSEYLSSIYYEKPLMKHSFPPMIFTIPGTPIPIYLRPELDISLIVQGSISPISATLNQSAGITAGINYSNSNWNPNFSFTKSFNYQLPTLPDASFSFSLNEKLFVSVYEMASPYIEPREYLTVFLNSGNPATWQVFGGLKLDIGIDTGIFSKIIPPFTKELIDYYTLLGSGSLGATPIPTSAPSPTSVPNLETIIIQQGPEGTDAYVTLNKYSDGTETYSGCGSCSYLNVDKYLSSISYESLISFSVPIFSGTIYSATISLYGPGSFLQENSIISVKRITSPWNEDVKWNNKPSYGETVSTTSLSDSTGWHNLDITSAVQYWVNSGENYGIALVTNSHRPTDPGFYSGDYSTASLRPKITITYSN